MWDCPVINNQVCSPAFNNYNLAQLRIKCPLVSSHQTGNPNCILSNHLDLKVIQAQSDSFVLITLYRGANGPV